MERSHQLTNDVEVNELENGAGLLVGRHLALVVPGVGHGRVPDPEDVALRPGGVEGLDPGVLDVGEVVQGQQLGDRVEVAQPGDLEKKGTRSVSRFAFTFFSGAESIENIRVSFCGGRCPQIGLKFSSRRLRKDISPPFPWPLSALEYSIAFLRRKWKCYTKILRISFPIATFTPLSIEWSSAFPRGNSLEKGWLKPTFL